MRANSKAGRVTINRVTINIVGEQAHINIPNPKNFVNIFRMLFLSVFTVVWFYAEMKVVRHLFRGELQGNALFFILFWLCVWSIAGGWMILTLLWVAVGSENITVGQGILKIEKKIFGIKINREYSLSLSRGFRVETEFDGEGYEGTKIAFDYGKKKVKFGGATNRAEARYILWVLSKKGFIHLQHRNND